MKIFNGRASKIYGGMMANATNYCPPILRHIWRVLYAVESTLLALNKNASII
jgi:hypothetical protein